MALMALPASAAVFASYGQADQIIDACRLNLAQDNVRMFWRASVVFAPLGMVRQVMRDFNNRTGHKAHLRKLVVGDSPGPSQNKPEAIFIVSATKVVLKKNASTQCTRPVLRILRLVKLTSAVCPDVPMTLAKYKKSP